jgi:hypothetical protein
MSVVALARVVRDELQQDLQGVERGILSGVKDKDEYWMLVGKRQGLQQALAVLDAQVQRFDQDD